MKRAPLPTRPRGDTGTRLTDGRRERSRCSRSKIVAAMIELVRNGDVSPQAARVAEVAGLGVRSVFRHFEDMETLYREMGEAIAEQVNPIVLQPPAGDTWKDKLRDIARRRAIVFEAILPFRVSASLRRFQSPYLMEDYNRLVALESAFISAHLPPAVAANNVWRDSLFLVLGFQSWRTLRQDHELDPKDAAVVMRQLLETLLSTLPDV